MKGCVAMAMWRSIANERAQPYKTRLDLRLPRLLDASSMISNKTLSFLLLVTLFAFQAGAICSNMESGGDTWYWCVSLEAHEPSSPLLTLLHPSAYHVVVHILVLGMAIQTMLAGQEATTSQVVIFHSVPHNTFVAVIVMPTGRDSVSTKHRVHQPVEEVVVVAAAAAAVFALAAPTVTVSSPR